MRTVGSEPQCCLRAPGCTSAATARSVPGVGGGLGGASENLSGFGDGDNRAHRWEFSRGAVGPGEDLRAPQLPSPSHVGRWPLTPCSKRGQPQPGSCHPCRSCSSGGLPRRGCAIPFSESSVLAAVQPSNSLGTHWLLGPLLLNCFFISSFEVCLLLIDWQVFSKTGITGIQPSRCSINIVSLSLTCLEI